VLIFLLKDSYSHNVHKIQHFCVCKCIAYMERHAGKSHYYFLTNRMSDLRSHVLFKKDVMFIKMIKKTRKSTTYKCLVTYDKVYEGMRKIGFGNKLPHFITGSWGCYNGLVTEVQSVLEDISRRLLVRIRASSYFYDAERQIKCS
jgi:hypothetical protein